MKRVFLNAFALAALALAVVSCDQKTTTEHASSTITKEAEAANKVAEENNPAATIANGKFEFTEDQFDFGTINEGDVVTHIFKFKNVGDGPLLITNARASCGCTLPEWPKEPIAVGQEGKITVKFNSKGKPNKQRKRISIYANTEPELSTLHITANVIPKKLEKAGPIK
ncbi:DUF1573 domain-containing protein [Persicobacter psychrovividus]|uniref:DUF1573 domain-containing protein n=1 Tax=Persicobacter psychrovividus TaxID=387638 RepID=A0ABM7VGW1_9BACT|nr:hypothetical protein PEPS_24580 [Persicobacter psychrovividus]